MKERLPVVYSRSRVVAMVATCMLLASGASCRVSVDAAPGTVPSAPAAAGTADPGAPEAMLSTEHVVADLGRLAVKGRAPKTGYNREQFGEAWSERVGGCDTRNRILQRDLTDESLDSDGCKVLKGTLRSAYSGDQVEFTRGLKTSDDVQIDHVVALSDAWQTGARQWSESKRVSFANDTGNLEAVEGSLNQQKGDSDAASWLPPDSGYRCTYVARQIEIKKEYELWVTDAEQEAMSRVLSACSGQVLSIPE